MAKPDDRMLILLIIVIKYIMPLTRRTPLLSL